MKAEIIKRGKCSIGNDVWISSHVIICPGCSAVGKGAVVGAGSVVTKNIPDFAIVAGNAARVICFKFPESVIAGSNKPKWWNSGAENLKKYAPLFSINLEASDLEYFPLLGKY